MRHRRSKHQRPRRGRSVHLAFVDARPPVRQCAWQLSERTDIDRVAYRPPPAGGVGGDQFPDQKGGASWPINASTTPPFPLLRLWTTTLPVLPSGNSNVKVFPTAFLGPLPALLAGRKSPAHGGVPPLRAGSAKSATGPGVLGPSRGGSPWGLRLV